MSWSTRRRNLWKGVTFLPHLETLADRTVPSVTSAFENGVLTLTGDDADDLVAIVSEGDGTFSVDLGDETETFEGVEQIVADLGDGDDEF